MRAEPLCNFPSVELTSESHGRLNSRQLIRDEPSPNVVYVNNEPKAISRGALNPSDSSKGSEAGSGRAGIGGDGSAETVVSRFLSVPTSKPDADVVPGSVNLSSTSPPSCDWARPRLASISGMRGWIRNRRRASGCVRGYGKLTSTCCELWDVSMW